MSIKVSILSRIKGLFNKNTGTSISQYKCENNISEVYETKTYGVDEHLYVNKLYLTGKSTMEEIVPNIEGYIFYKIVDHAGYEVDDVATYQGEVYIMYSNIEIVEARVDEFRVPGGLIASRYIGTSLAKVTKKK